MLEKAERLFTEWRQIPWEREPIQPGQDPREGATGMLAYTPHHKRTLIRLIALALQSSEGALQSRDDAMESLRQDALRRLVVEEKRADVAESARASAEKAMSDMTGAVMQDLADLLNVLGLGDHARPQTPHEVFRECIASVAEITQQREEAEGANILNRNALKQAKEEASAAMEAMSVCCEAAADAVKRSFTAKAESSSLAQKAQEAERERCISIMLPFISWWEHERVLSLVRALPSVPIIGVCEAPPEKHCAWIGNGCDKHFPRLPSAPSTPESMKENE
jgi:hypothetical protein